MMQQEIINNNKLIAEFMGLNWEHSFKEEFRVVLNEGTEREYRPIAVYHSSWEWLLPVVEMIESFTVENQHQYEVHITGWDCYIVNRNGDVIVDYSNERNKIDAVYLACVDFIKWFNRNKSI